MRLEIQAETRTLGMDGMGDAEFVRILIDGVEIATDAAAFDASSPEITPNECEFCYHCGVPTIAVRKIADHTVVWFSNPDHGREYDVPAEEFRYFDLVEYESALGGKATGLPEFSAENLHHIFSLEQFPDWKEFLYCLPEIVGDGTGAATMGLITESISNLTIVPGHQDILKFETVAFGFDIDNLLETRIDFALIADEIAFRFQSFPCIPIWLTIESDPNGFAAIKRHIQNAG